MTFERSPDQRVTTRITSMIDQGEWWRDAAGTWTRIAELEISHAANLLGWLERRADAIKFKYELGMCGYAPQGEMALDSFESAMQELAETPPLDWLHSTQLYRAVLARSQAPLPRPDPSGVPTRLRDLVCGL